MNDASDDQIDTDLTIDLTDPENFLVPVGDSVPVEVTSDMPVEWDMNTPKRKALLRRSVGSASVKHGILSSIPMICRDTDCPYKEHCVYQQAGEVVRGERCILEIGKLVKASEQYYREFGVDPSNPEHRTDAILIQELLTNEILIDRCLMLLASGNLVEQVDAAMNPQGDIIQQPQLHKAADYLPKLQRRRDETLQLLAATRKDKIAAATSIGISIDQFTKNMIEREQVINARLEAMRTGNLALADQMGMDYSMQQHAGDIIDAQAIPLDGE